MASSHEEMKDNRDFIDKLRTMLENGETSAAIQLFTDNPKTVQEGGWELIPIICDSMTEERLSSIPELSQCTTSLLDSITAKANPKEVLLGLLEQAEALKENPSDAKFKLFLAPIQKVLLILPNMRGESLAWTLNCLYAYIGLLPIPHKYVFEGEERKRGNNAEAHLQRIGDVIPPLIEFHGLFVHEISLYNEAAVEKKQGQLKEHRKALASFLLQIFDRPMVFLDLSVNKDNKSVLRLCAEQIMEYLIHLMSNFCSLLDHIDTSSLFHERRKKDLDAEDMESEEDFSYSSTEGRVSNLSLGTFYYMCLSEKICLSHVPCVYSSVHLLLEILPLTICLLRRTEDCVVHKGLHLGRAATECLSARTLSAALLESSVHTDFISALIHVMVFCPVDEFRLLASKIVPEYIRKFDDTGRFQLLRGLLTCNKHSGVLSFLIGMVKENVMFALDQVSRQKKSPSNCQFLGANLGSLCMLIFVLPNGVDTDLLENSDHVITALNLLRFVLLRDRDKNLSGIKDNIPRIKKTFLEPLQQALDLSKTFYSAKQNEMGENSRCSDNNKHKLLNAKQTVDSMSVDHQKEVASAAMNMFDLIRCVLIRVNELC